MEEELIIPILFFFIAALGGICLLIFCFRKMMMAMITIKL